MDYGSHPHREEDRKPLMESEPQRERLHSDSKPNLRIRLNIKKSPHEKDSLPSEFVADGRNYGVIRDNKKIRASKKNDAAEMKEMWDAVTGGGNSEGRDGDDDEIDALLKPGKKRKRTEKTAAEVALSVENAMAELEVAAEEDAELNRRGKPAVCKLKKLPKLSSVLSKKQLQKEFLDHGVLSLLKNWLEPLPDGSLPNINVRAAVLQILSDFPIDLERFDRREQIKRSGVGKVVMFLSKSDEETAANRRVAKELIDRWSRMIFDKNSEEERVVRRAPVEKSTAAKGAGMSFGDDGLDLVKHSHGSKSSESMRQRVSRPEAVSMDFAVRPALKVNPEAVRAPAKNGRREKICKRLIQMKAFNRRKLHATKVSVEGRGMLTYL